MSAEAQLKHIQRLARQSLDSRGRSSSMAYADALERLNLSIQLISDSEESLRHNMHLVGHPLIQTMLISHDPDLSIFEAALRSIVQRLYELRCLTFDTFLDCVLVIADCHKRSKKLEGPEPPSFEPIKAMGRTFPSKWSLAAFFSCRSLWEGMEGAREHVKYPRRT
jgi:hypothetical protein